MILKIESQYFPPIILFKSLFNFSNIYFNEYEPYQKISFRNRCIIAGANGPITLTIPLEQGRNQKTQIKDVRMSGSKWKKEHWKSIVSCYNHSPWFESYQDELAAIYEAPSPFLFDWNIRCFEWACSRLDLSCSVTRTEPQEDISGEETVDWHNKILPKNHREFSPLRYRQVFEEKTGFLPNLSILDLLFCEGSKTSALLMS